MAPVFAFDLKPNNKGCIRSATRKARGFRRLEVWGIPDTTLLD